MEHFTAIIIVLAFMYWQVILNMIEFNPTKTEKTIITLRIETDLLSELDILSGKVDISRNEFILQCIDFALKHYPKIQEKK